MHIHDTTPWQHDHHYVSDHERHSERRTLAVVVLTAVMMLVEIVCGVLFHSMALLADGWHMSTHAGALGLAALAYSFARRHARDSSFTFGTGKVNALGGFTSAVILAMIALWVGVESLFRLATPQVIDFDQALVVAVIGLGVNCVSAWLLKGEPRQQHGPEHGHAHDAPHHDHTLEAAYFHVLADALTSVLAIAALLIGKYLGWVWMDPVMGLVGSLIIAHWSMGLLRHTSIVLLDQAPDTMLKNTIHETLERDADTKVTDLHLWQIAPGSLSAIIALTAARPKSPQHYKTLLHTFHHLVHVTVEVNTCG